MKNCPKCGSLTVSFCMDSFRGGYRFPDYDLNAAGIACQKGCGWKLTMKDLMKQLENLRADCEVIANWALRGKQMGRCYEPHFFTSSQIYQITKGWQKKPDKKEDHSPQGRFEERIKGLEMKVSNLQNWLDVLVSKTDFVS